MRPTLLERPYRTPRLRVGEAVYCEYHGREVLVDVIESRPIGEWPCYRRLGGVAAPIVTGDLARAIRTESEQAVAYWWGVSRATAKRWRKRLSVPRFNRGTRERWRELAAQRLPAARRKSRG